MSSVGKCVRVLLGDHHRLVRAGLRALLERLPEVQVVGEADDGQEVLDFLRETGADVVVMDTAMPRLNGWEATARISTEFPWVRVIILSREQTEDHALKAIRAGASGYLPKRAGSDELEMALNRVASGEVYVSRHLSHATPGGLSSEDRFTLLDALTDRQRDILQMLAEGQTAKAIAFSLGVSPKTVEYHRARIMERLQIHDLPGLVRFALRVGLVGQEA